MKEYKIPLKNRFVLNLFGDNKVKYINRNKLDNRKKNLCILEK